jgi:23S rRNA (guanosine2251-2'-O)-methyltransferase
MQIIGRKPVLEALKADKPVKKIYLSETVKGKFLLQLNSLANNKDVPIDKVPQKKLDSMAKGQNTQGVLAVKKGEFNYSSFDEILGHSKSQTYPLLLLLDSVQDPHNLGAIIRSAEAAGVDGIILTTDKSASVNETVEKTSAGAVSNIKICRVTNLNRTIQELKDEGYWIYGSQLEGAQQHTKLDYKNPIALILGNEEKGIRRLVAENCDFLVKIPMKGKTESLNVSVAAGILLFEINRQRETL